MSIEEQAGKFIEKHKKTQKEKERLEVRLEMKREELKKIRREIEKMGFKDVAALRKAAKDKEDQIREIIGED